MDDDTPPDQQPDAADGADAAAAFAALVREPCLIYDDLVEIAIAEPETWKRFASTAEHSLWKADWSAPFFVVRTHREDVDGQELVFVLVAMKHEDEDEGGAIFGEFACSAALYDQRVKEYAVPNAIPRRAHGFEQGAMTPSERDDMHIEALLEGDRREWPF